MMVHVEAIGWLNTALPLVVLVALTLILPWYLLDPDTRSHVKVAHGMIGVVGLLLLAGVVISMALAQMRGFDPQGHLMQHPLQALAVHTRLSLMAALVWGPVLLLVWYSQARAVEARRGLDMMRTGRSDIGSGEE